MSIGKHPAGLRRFALADIAAEPWQNGGGLTRPIGAGRLLGVRAVAAASGSDIDWSWRVSVADIEQSGAFSVLENTHRCSALLGLAPVTLRSARETLHFAQRGDHHAYEGGTEWQSSLPSGATRFFNLITRRGDAKGRVSAIFGSATLQAAPVTVLLVGQGTFGVNLVCRSMQTLEFRLTQDTGLLLEGVEARLVIEPLAGQCCLLNAEVRRP